MAKFKVGDRVRAIRPVDGNDKIVNQTGTVIIIKCGLYRQYSTVENGKLKMSFTVPDGFKVIEW